VKLFTDAPWNGTRTPAFRKFKRDFKVGANGMFLQDDLPRIPRLAEKETTCDVRRLSRGKLRLLMPSN